jgi:ribosomal protein S18 acetylase RimI-like enzyme
VRAGRLQDLPGLRTLWAHEVLSRGRDCVPSEAMVARMMSDFDWATRSRVIEDRGGLRAAVMLLEHDSRERRLVRVETAARDEGDRLRLVRWGLSQSRSLGATVAQVWRPKGYRQGMAALGMSLARPFWRMDRTDLEELPEAPLPPGYRLAAASDRRTAVAVFNRSFADHWRFHPLDPEGPPSVPRPRDLELTAFSVQGAAVAVVWCEVGAYDPDPRPQPVGVIEVVGTVPEHRRRGLAYSMTAEAMRRLRRRGAACASLYVDGLNPTRAYDVYSRLGFAVAYQYEVFETQL